MLACKDCIYYTNDAGMKKKNKGIAEDLIGTQNRKRLMSLVYMGVVDI